MSNTPGYDPPDVPFTRTDRRLGRMWFATSYLVGDAIRPADDDFVAWASSVLGWTRRHWIREGSDYESPTARRLFGDP